MGGGIFFSLEMIMNTENKLKALFGTNGKEQRALKRWSQMTLAEMINVSTNTISEIETGKKFVTANTLASLADVFQIDTYELFKPKYILPYDAILSYSQDVKIALDAIADKYFKSKLN
jgi:transcriptional regulator with XRE-family HTH domain